MRARCKRAPPTLVARRGWAVAAKLAASLAAAPGAPEEKCVETKHFLAYPESAATPSQAQRVAGLAERAPSYHVYCTGSPLVEKVQSRL
jgi:hypothetical protein